MKLFVGLLTLIGVCLGAINHESNVRFVEPRIGTLAMHSNNYGGMIPTTGTPFAMTRWTPYTQENVVGTCPYLYEHNQFHGFLGTHQPAVWMGESAQVSVSAGTGSVKTSFEDRALYYSHDEETTSPHYYSVNLKASEDAQETIIKAELSSKSRAGDIRFSFTSKSSNYVVVQATRAGIVGNIEINPSKREITGYNPERQDSVLGPFTADDFKGYFVVQFDHDFATWGTASGATLVPDQISAGGQELSAFVTFADGVNVVNARVGVSYISIDQARQNIRNELPKGTTLEDTAAAVHDAWAQKLDLIYLTNATADESAIFFTGMYHALQYPCEMMESNSSGTYYYSGFDNRVHAGDYSYTGYSIWDTFRAEWSFLNMFAPERIHGMITSMLQTYQQGGRLPIWQNIVETNIMIGTHSSSLIAESLAKGFRGFDLDLAWEALKKDADVPPENDLTTTYYDRQEGTGCEARAGLTREKEVGFVPCRTTSEAGSRTLEYAYDDYTVARFAELTGRQEDAKFYHDRSMNYKNIFNSETMMMEAKFENGSWCSSPETWTEATDWIYTFNVQHDFPGLRNLFNGADGLGSKLDAYYEGGHNDQTNEPSHATAFAYLYANQPWKAQSVIRELLRDNYFNNATGLSGNDDCGQMSAWYIYNAIGFYPANPASGEYLIGTPIFDRVDITLPPSPANGYKTHKLTVTAPGARNNLYVRSVSTDGVVHSSPILRHTEVYKTSHIAFDMTNTPQQWAVGTL